MTNCTTTPKYVISSPMKCFIFLSLFLFFISSPSSLANNSEKKMQTGERLEESGDYERAEKTYQDILKTGPENKEALLGLARTQYWQGHYKEAEKTYEQLLKIDPENVGGLVGMGKTQLALGNQKKAKTYF